MALIGEADFLCDQRKRRDGPQHEGFCPLDPPLYDIALQPDVKRLRERTAEVVWAEQAICSAICDGSTNCTPSSPRALWSRGFVVLGTNITAPLAWL